MAEKRDNYRHRKRIAVRFGLESPNASGYTEDLSNDGIFIKSALVHGPGREVEVELKLDNQQLVRLIAKVQWAKRVPPALLRTCKGGMGLGIIRFVEGEAAYRDLCEDLRQIQHERENVVARPLISAG